MKKAKNKKQPARYGKTESEKLIEEKIKAREIVQEIMRFGVTPEQLTHVIYLLALEVSDRELMIKLVNVIEPGGDHTTAESKKIII